MGQSTVEMSKNALFEVDKGSSVYATAKKYGVPEQTAKMMDD